LTLGYTLLQTAGQFANFASCRSTIVKALQEDNKNEQYIKTQGLDLYLHLCYRNWMLIPL